MSFSFDQELDCSGLACSMPILKTKKAKAQKSLFGSLKIH
jgi:TusA-related sulfurtransferase